LKQAVGVVSAHARRTMSSILDGHSA